MNSGIKWAGIALALAAAVPPQAQAQPQAQGVTEALSFTSPFSVPSSGGWTVQMSQCQYTNNGGAGNCSTESVVASVTGSTLSMVFSGTNGPAGTNAFLYTTGGVAGSESDLSLNLIVTAPSGQAIYLATNSMTGSTAGVATNVSDGETFTNPTEPQINTNLSATFKSEAFAPVISKPLSVGNDWIAGNGMSQSTIATATLTFNAPEPVSSSLLMVGLAGLGFSRRKLRRLD